MSKTLVFEIGIEEMPAGAAKSGMEQLDAAAWKLLKDYRLQAVDERGDLNVFGTPRRLVLIVRDLAEKQTPATEAIKGPPKRAGFTDDGAPTPAAFGFAKSQGVDVNNLKVREIDGREYLFAVKELPGRSTQEILPEMLTSLVGSLEFKKTMRWGAGRLRFIRPIRWLLALYDYAIVAVELDGLKSGRLTWGHRFLAEGPFEVEKARDYEDVMARAGVILDPEVRRTSIVGQVEAIAVKAGGLAAINPRVLEEVVYLVEDPYAVRGSFDEEFLKIPRAVAVTAMESHQRYFPIENRQNELLPLFAVVHNGNPEWSDQIGRGHERVLRARLADAAFFFHEDTKTTLESKVDRLKDVVWQTRLGTMYEKVERIRELGKLIARKLELDQKVRQKIDRAAYLCKADLTTSMVIEFTDLQGIIGREYALVDGENQEVAEAVEEHYRPRSARDEKPETVVGQVIAVADKIDTITGCFLVGLIPSGSTDPYSLRRQAVGIMGILVATGWQIGILDLIRPAIDNYAKCGITTGDPKAVIAKLRDFILARLKRSLKDAGSDPDIFEAVAAAGFDNVGVIDERVRVIENYKGKKQLEDIRLAFTRCRNLARTEYGEEVNPSLFEADTERLLFDETRRIQKGMEEIMRGGRIESAIDLLAGLREPIDAFFEDVLVMVADERIRANRIKLLNLILSISGQVADFSKLPPGK